MIASPLGRQPGFTLLEILIATLVTAMLMTAAVTVFRNITRTQERAMQDDSRARGAHVLLDRLERELVGSLLVIMDEEEDRLQHPWVFLGGDHVFDSNDTDSLVFITQNPSRAAGVPPMHGLRMVEYMVAPSDEEDRFDLFRGESPLPGKLERQTPGDLIPVVEGVHAFQLEYQSEESGGWRDDWDSTDLGLLDELPGAVKITVQLMEHRRDGTEEPGSEYTRTVHLPVRPLVQDPPENEGGCPGGMTVAKCFRILRDQIQGLRDSPKKFVLDLRLAVTDRCWNPEKPTQALTRMKTELPKYLVNDPSAENQCG